MSKEILFIVGNAIYNNDGYKSRIEMEMDLLSFYKLHIFLPRIEGKSIEFRNDVMVHFYELNLKKGIIFKVFSIRNFQRSLNKVLYSYEIDAVVCEGLGAAIKAGEVSLKKGIRVIFDCHGTEPDEYYLYHRNFKGYLWSRILKYFEKRVINRCDILLTVSTAQYEKWNPKKKYKHKHFVLPMLPAEHFLNDKSHRDEVRKKLNIENNTKVYVYSGGNQKWQMSEYMLSVYKKIEETCIDTMLLILSHDVMEFKKLIQIKQIKNVKVVSVGYNEMPAYLDACDFGFCLRENSIVNLVASPTKVLEYLTRNVKPILTKYVGDYSQQLKEKKLAIVVGEKYKTDIFYKEEDYGGRDYVIAYRNQIKERYIEFIKTEIEKIKSED